MFYVSPAPTMVSPSMATKLFGEIEDGKPSMLVMKGLGASNANQIVNQELSSQSTEGLYNLYRMEKVEEVEGEEVKTEYAVATPNVNPYLLIEHPDLPGKPYAIFEPRSVSFNGDIVWTRLWPLTNPYPDKNLHLLDEEVMGKYPNSLKTALSNTINPQNGYFSIQKSGNILGNNRPLLVWTKYLEDNHTAAGSTLMFQYPWDTAEWKAEHSDEISAYNAQYGGEKYVPEEEVFHGPCGAKYAYYAYIEPVDPIKDKKLNGDAMVFYPSGAGRDHLKSFYGYFFYPLLYIDGSGNGILEKLKAEDMPDYMAADISGVAGPLYRADESGVNAATVYLTNEISSSPDQKRYGTPVWRVEFDQCPFPVDSKRNYYCAFINDGYALTVNISSQDLAKQTYFNRPSIDNNVILWSEPKSNVSDNTPGKDARIEDIVKVGLEQTKDYEGHRNWWRFTSCVFYSQSHDVYYKTNGCPRRGSSATATEQVPEGAEPKGGSVHMHWNKNSVVPITPYYLTGIDSFRTQPVLDGANMNFGIFQVLETRIKPN